MTTGRAVLSRDEAAARAKLISDAIYWPELTLPATADDNEFKSKVKVFFDCAEAGAASFIDLDAKELVSAALNGKRLDVSTCKDGRLPLENLNKGGNVLEVQSVHQLSNNGTGLTRELDEGDNNAPYFHTQFEDFHAHKVFACFDQPNIKGYFNWEITAPKDWQVRTNTDCYQTVDAGNGMAQRSYATTKKIPTYLAATTAGPFTEWHDEYESIDGRKIPLTLACRRSMAQYLEPDKEIWFDTLKKTLHFYEEFFGVPYQFPKYDQVIVPNFKAGAMENPGLVTFYEQVIFRGAASPIMQAYRREVIRHEAAHMWFGDVRTMDWWDDLWLNETFATFMASQVSRALDPASTSGVLDNDDKLKASVLDQMPTNHPIVNDVSTTDNVNDYFDSITYEKGFAAMFQLAELLGKENFKRGVQRYFRDFDGSVNWKNGTLAEFLDALQQEAPAGVDLKAWSKEWLQSKGTSVLWPLADTDAKGRMKQAFVGQTLAPNATQVMRPHVLEVGLYDLVSAPKSKLMRRLRLRSKVNVKVAGELTAIPELNGKKAPAVMLVNDSDLTYAKTRLTPQSLETVEKYIGTVKDPSTRAQMWSAVWHLTRDAEFPAARFARMAYTQALDEKDPVLLELILRRAAKASGAAELGRATGEASGYASPQNRPALLTELADVSRSAMTDAKRPLEARRLWFNTYLASVAGSGRGDDVQYLRDLVAGNQTVPGLDLSDDADARWKVVTALATAGGFTESEIRQEAARDNSIQGRAGLLTSLAAQGNDTAKGYAYYRLLWDKSLTVQEVRALITGFNAGNSALRERFTANFADDVERLCQTKTNEEVKEIVAGLMPPVGPAGLRAAQDALLRPGITGTARRALMEGIDNMKRVMACRTCDGQGNIREMFGSGVRRFRTPQAAVQVA